jgi:amino acid transporter
MARDGAFFSFAGRVHPRWGTPSGAVVIQALCALAMVFVSLPNLFSYIGVSLTFCTALAVGSLLILRQRAGWKKLRIISFAYPAVPVGCLCIAGAMTLYSVMLKPAPSLSAAATVLGGCWLCHKLIRRDDSLGYRTGHRNGVRRIHLNVRR